MIELQYVTNERTGQRRLYFRQDILSIDASGSFCPGGKTSWEQVPEKTLNDIAWDDLRDSGGIVGAP